MITERQSTDEGADATDLDEPIEPSVICGRYRIVRRLATGGMGVVYEAHHLVLRRRFAIKVLRRRALGGPEASARLKREAMAVAELESEHIASVVDFGEDERGQSFLVMELLRGTDLHGLLEVERSIAAHRACNLVVQACHGLEAAHARGIIHRDLKPSNLFVCRRSEGGDLVKVLDFGIAKVHRGADPDSLGTGARIIGTLGYMAPEQIECASSVDARADVYSLGVVLYRCLAGKLPYSGGTPVEMLHQILYAQPEPLVLASSTVVPELAAIVHRALARKPEHRFSSVAEFRLALSPFVADCPPKYDPVAPVNSPGRLVRRSSSMRRPGAAALAVAALVAGGGVLMRQNETASGSFLSGAVSENVRFASHSATPATSLLAQSSVQHRTVPATSSIPSASHPAASAPAQSTRPHGLPRLDQDRAFARNRVVFDATNPYR